jgi:hypothetical protein
MQGYTWRDRMSFSVPSGSAPGTQRIDGTRRALPRWTIVRRAGILIAPWGHL